MIDKFFLAYNNIVSYDVFSIEYWFASKRNGNNKETKEKGRKIEPNEKSSTINNIICAIKKYQQKTFRL